MQSPKSGNPQAHFAYAVPELWEFVRTFCLCSLRNPWIPTHILLMQSLSSENSCAHFAYAVSEIRESTSTFCLCSPWALGIHTHILLMQSKKSENLHAHILYAVPELWEFVRTFCVCSPWALGIHTSTSDQGHKKNSFVVQPKTKKCWSWNWQERHVTAVYFDATFPFFLSTAENSVCLLYEPGMLYLVQVTVQKDSPV
jgi:hypothetical protein